jgi:hypothetical protein
LVAAKIRGNLTRQVAGGSNYAGLLTKIYFHKGNFGARFHISRPVIPLPEARSLIIYVDVLKRATSADFRTRGMENISATIRINFPQYCLDLDD